MSKRALPALALALSIFAPLHAAKLPRPAPPFKIQMPDGKEVALESYKGKVVALAFILTTCSHCQNYTRILNKMHYEFNPQGLQVVASAIEENARPAVPAFIRAYAPPYPVGYNDFGLACDFLEHPRTQVLHMPVIAFIDRKGNILGQYQAGEPFMESNPEQDLRTAIQGLLSGKISVESISKEAAKEAAAKKAAPAAKTAPGTKTAQPTKTAPKK